MVKSISITAFVNFANKLGKKYGKENLMRLEDTDIFSEHTYFLNFEDFAKTMTDKDRLDFYKAILKTKKLCWSRAMIDSLTNRESNKKDQELFKQLTEFAIKSENPDICLRLLGTPSLSDESHDALEKVILKSGNIDLIRVGVLFARNYKAFEKSVLLSNNRLSCVRFLKVAVCIPEIRKQIDFKAFEKIIKSSKSKRDKLCLDFNEMNETFNKIRDESENE